ncbi:TcmI family type II polyketide cyclase [Streptomyces fimicarius]|uniref:TcmI family type II polyketide cyclase n=2 Tax=Streptomyces TaxID=1883 RepID=A0AB33KGV0_9ACTN|nr:MULTISPECIES: TcmI family type II polyketide cyclase [Streptomyces]MCL6291376.1 TcmI family type II polyketide cyclase [Streptomyces sp. 43Y-GA-1]MDX2669874.1 TcmI family type II polyketide cyclase [Streptomyces sp. NRRL_ISP-5395]MDX3336773.1 TcmI family type II polyketide cyclase [Streptomyces sp. ME02-6979.5a]MDX3501014.1 TcmI family type II polyketide cyclase [Streptomyces sp. ATCC51928]MDX3591272.1 TcmI family type II polyketide cyclase [Streptomyces sp. ID03-2B]
MKHSNLIVARMDERSSTEVAQLFTEFDRTDMPHRMGTLRRRLFMFNGLYFHLQDFASDDGGTRIQNSRNDPRFVQISHELKPFIEPYDPETWRTPADAMATRFYDWSAGE